MSRPIVRASLEAPGGLVCVDLFERPDGSFGFEIYRRDLEDSRGWGSPAGHATKRFLRLTDARRAAADIAPWLTDRRTSTF